MTRERLFKILRIAFGAVWAVDAAFKWTPAFQNSLSGMLSSMLTGQPAAVAWWIGIWAGAAAAHPHFFAVLIALAESALALALIFDLLPQTTYITGFIFSIFVWSVGEGFGGPYSAGSTDIGAAVMYAFVFAALYFERFGSPGMASAPPPAGKDLTVKLLSVAVIVLLALLAAPYFVTRTSTAQQTDMPPGMAMKTFYIGPLPGMATSTDGASSMSGMDMGGTDAAAVPAGILASTTAPAPTVSFTIVKDALDGWDLHITTTNFTWTPQLINQAPVADQGHAHLYIDGVLSVLFGPWYHIDGDLLPPGTHTITVSLNANDHSVFSVGDQPVQETQTLVVSPI